MEVVFLSFSAPHQHRVSARPIYPRTSALAVIGGPGAGTHCPKALELGKEQTELGQRTSTLFSQS